MWFLILILSICVIILFVKQRNFRREILKQAKSIQKLREIIHEMTQTEDEQSSNTTVTPPTQGAPIPTPQNTPTVATVAHVTHTPTSVTKIPIPTPQTTNTTAQKPIKAKPKWFRSEDWVGISLANRLGSLLIIIGAIAIASFEGFHANLRTVVLFAFALAWIAIGEFKNRKGITNAGIGLSATGVALVYVAIATSYFGLETLSVIAALLCCIAATALSVFLAIRYNTQIIGCFALIGGYLPIFALNTSDETMLIGIIVYFLFLSLVSLLLALKKKWPVMNILGFVLTIVGTSYIGWIGNAVIALVYACFAFLLYTALPLLSTHRTKEKFTGLDFSLVITNTFVSSIIIFLIANRLEIEHLHAFLCLFFALIYILLAQLVKHMLKHKEMQTIFTLESIAFCALFVPFFFDQQWFAAAWSIQATVISCYGILRNRKLAEYSGLAILLLSALTLANTVFLNIQMTFHYTTFTIGTLIILATYFIKKRQLYGYGQVHKCLTLLNLWFFVIYLMFQYITDSDFVISWILFATLILALIYAKIPLWATNEVRIIANIMHSIALLGLWATNLYYLYTDNHSGFIANLIITVIAFSLVLYYHLSEKRTTWNIAYKNISIVHLWLSLVFILYSFIERHLTAHIIVVSFTFILMVLIVKLSILRDKATHIIANVIHGITLILLLTNSFVYYIDYSIGLIFNLAATFIAFFLILYYQVSEQKNRWTVVYKNINIVYVWIMIVNTLGELLNTFSDLNHLLINMLLIILTFIISISITRISMLRDKGSEVISLILVAFCIFSLWVINVEPYYPIQGMAIFNIHILTQLIALIAIYNTVNIWCKKEKERPWQIVILSTYFSAVLTQYIMVQRDVSFNSAGFSILYALIAFTWIIVGFKLKLKLIRLLGLWLSIAAVAKLLIVDTWGTSAEMRIISYISLGLILIIISFVYQRLNKKINQEKI